MPAKKKLKPKSSIPDDEAIQIAMAINRSEFCRTIGQENVYREFITDGGVSDNVGIIIDAWQTIYPKGTPTVSVEDAAKLAEYFVVTGPRGKVDGWVTPSDFAPAEGIHTGGRG